MSLAVHPSTIAVISKHQLGVDATPKYQSESFQAEDRHEVTPPNRYNIRTKQKRSKRIWGSSKIILLKRGVVGSSQRWEANH